MINILGSEISAAAYNNRLYAQSNEDLTGLFKDIDFRDKNVLSVLASSDQMLTSYYKGAKSVKTFDRNVKTLFYFYFRRWFTNTFNEVQPDFSTDVGHVNIRKYANMVNNFVPKSRDEAISKKYWLSVLTPDFKASNYFNYIGCCNRNEIDWHCDFVKETLNKDIDFSCIDMFAPIASEKKFDIIVVSNMLEYLNQNVDDEEKENPDMDMDSVVYQDDFNINIVRKNIEHLLVDGGMVVCSCINRQSNKKTFEHEKEIMTQGELEYSGHYSYYEPLIGSYRQSGYSYIKKRTR